MAHRKINSIYNKICMYADEGTSKLLLYAASNQFDRSTDFTIKEAVCDGHTNVANLYCTQSQPFLIPMTIALPCRSWQKRQASQCWLHIVLLQEGHKCVAAHIRNVDTGAGSQGIDQERHVRACHLTTLGCRAEHVLPPGTSVLPCCRSCTRLI